MMSRWRRPVTLLAAVVLGAAACGTGGGGDQQAQPEGKGDGVLKLGYVLPQTGSLAYLGPPQIQAAEFARSEINKAGGVLGEKIPEMPAGDEADDEAVASQSADRVLNQDVDAVIGAAASGMSLAFIDKVTGSNTVQCSGSNTAPTFTDYDDGGYYFRTAWNDVLQGPILADTIIQDGHQKIAAVARADDYGKGLLQATTGALEESGAQITVNQTYDPDAQNFDALVQKIKSSSPDAVVIIGFEESVQILQTMIENGIGPDKVGVYGADGMRSEELGKLVSPNDPGIIAGQKGTAPAAGGDPQFLDRLQEFAPKLKETTFAPHVYDCVNIVALAAEVAESDDPSVFKDEVVGVTKGGQKCTSFADCKKLIDDGEDIDYQGVSGPLDFVPQGEPGRTVIEVYGYNKQGKLETLDTVKSTSLKEAQEIAE